MIYILDAYNVIHKTPALAAALDQDLRRAREALIHLCSEWAGSRGGISKIILVFDGKSQFRDLPQSSPAKIELVFSETGEAADERIVAVMEDLGEKAAKCVVSDDNFVRNQARAFKARALSVREFNQNIIGGGTKSKNAKSSSSKRSLSNKEADEITAAYKRYLGLG